MTKPMTYYDRTKAEGHIINLINNNMTEQQINEHMHDHINHHFDDWCDLDGGECELQGIQLKIVMSIRDMVAVWIGDDQDLGDELWAEVVW